MAEAQNNIKLLHRKEWQTMTPAPVASAAGLFVITGGSNIFRFSLYVCSATVHYLYDHDNDDWIQIPSGAFGTAIAAGACGTFSTWGLTYTGTGGSTTTVTINAAVHNINGFVVGQTIEFLSGTAANIGLRRTITAIKHPGTATGTITLTLDTAVTSSVANNDTFRISSGMFFVLMPGTLTATSFRKYDIATSTWTSCTNTGLPATWGTDADMIRTGLKEAVYDTGTATSASNTTSITCTGKAWANDQWINYQVRITAGTGLGQIRVITDNTADTLTFASGTDLDETSVFAIEGDENALYAIGNGNVAMYKYSISANSWATLAPTTARGGAPAAGMTADFVGVTGNTGWADITNIQDGQYIYSFRGGSAILDRFKISGGTNGAGAWEVVAYNPYITTFATGASADWLYGTPKIYIVKEGTAAIPMRFYVLDVVENCLCPVTTDWLLAGAALLGNKMWCKTITLGGPIKWIYYLQSTSTMLRRITIY
jgi:hypothetical protein